VLVIINLNSFNSKIIVVKLCSFFVDDIPFEDFAQAQTQQGVKIIDLSITYQFLSYLFFIEFRHQFYGNFGTILI